jgi:hypothetical protein
MWRMRWIDAVLRGRQNDAGMPETTNATVLAGDDRGIYGDYRPDPL